MNDETIEDLLRSRLRTLAPRDVPATLVLAAAAVPTDAPRARKITARPERRMSFRFGLAFATMAVVAVLTVGLVLNGLGKGGVAGQPIPTLPPVTQPSLPPAAANPTQISDGDGAWVSPTVAWLVDDRWGLHMTEDGGLTWSQTRPLPKVDLRGNPTFLDANFGYSMWSQPGVSPVEAQLVITRDGGRTWSFIPVGTLPAVKSDMNSLTAHFVDHTHGVVLAGLYVSVPAASGDQGTQQQVACVGWTTEDGGQTWADVPHATCSNDDVWASPTVGLIFPIVGGGPRVTVTLDGGRTARDGTLPEVGADDFAYPMAFDLGSDGALQLAYLIYHRGDVTDGARTLYVAESRDGGATWALAVASVQPAFPQSGISVLGPGHWITSGVGFSSPATPTPILETVDAGRTWAVTGSLGTINGSIRSFYDRLHGMASGADTAGCGTLGITQCHGNSWFLTNDGGVTWHGLPF